MRKRRSEREYDSERKARTLKVLREGFAELKRLYPDKPVTKYALSKHTGVARETIRKYPEINSLFEEEADLKCKVDTIFGKKKIKSLTDVKGVIVLYEKELKKREKKYADLIKVNTSLNMKIVQQDDEIRRLSNLLDRYRKAIKNESK